MPSWLEAHRRPLPSSELCPLSPALGGVNERTFVAIKPDGVQRRLVGEIIRRFERKGLQLVGMKLLQVSRQAHPGWASMEPRSSCSPRKPRCAGNCWGSCLSSDLYSPLVSFQHQILAAQRTAGAGRGDSSSGEHVCPWLYLCSRAVTVRWQLETPVCVRPLPFHSWELCKSLILFTLCIPEVQPLPRSPVWE